MALASFLSTGGRVYDHGTSSTTGLLRLAHTEKTASSVLLEPSHHAMRELKQPHINVSWPTAPAEELRSQLTASVNHQTCD